MTERVVITGLGVVSCLGNDAVAVKDALFNGRSGISLRQDHVDAGMRSQIAGTPDIDLSEHIDRKQWRFMGDAAGYAYLSLQQAIAHAGLSDAEVSNPRTGIVAGSGGASSANQVEAADVLRDRGIRRVGPYRVTQTMGSTISACLTTPFQIKGVNYSISSACSTSAHCIGHAMELIQLGKQDVVFAGGGGMLVVESLTHARARGANILAELVGYGATSDGYDMVAPSGEGAVRCMQQAMHGLEGQIDYINAHGTSTPAGDIQELNALRTVFGEQAPVIGSTKSLSGHSLGAAGVQEAIYSLLMMQDDFIAASANIETLDEGAEGMPIAMARVDKAGLQQVMSNSFGFGGTNATLIFRRYTD